VTHHPPPALLAGYFLLTLCLHFYLESLSFPVLSFADTGSGVIPGFGTVSFILFALLAVLATPLFRRHFFEVHTGCLTSRASRASRVIKPFIFMD
jgi:hypothetical protein